MAYDRVDDVLRDLTQMREYLEQHEASISRQYLCEKIKRLTDLVQKIMSDHKSRIETLEYRMDEASKAFSALRSTLEKQS